MIGYGQFMSDGILLHKTFEGSIAKVGAIITDGSTRGSEAWEVLFQKIDYSLNVTSFSWNGFYPLGHIVHSNQNVLVPKWIRK